MSVLATTLDKLHVLETIYRQGYHNDVIDQTLDKLLDFERAQARRELQEETGYRTGHIEPLLSFFTTPGICTEWMYAFVATDLTAVGQNLQGAERIEVERIDVDAARDRLLRGEFEDGKTIAVLGRYLLGMQSGMD